MRLTLLSIRTASSLICAAQQGAKNSEPSTPLTPDALRRSRWKQHPSNTRGSAPLRETLPTHPSAHPSSGRTWCGLDDLQRHAPTGGHLYWHGDRGQLWVTGGKTPSEYIFSELPQVADIARSAFHDLASPPRIPNHCVLGPSNSRGALTQQMPRDHPE